MGIDAEQRSFVLAINGMLRMSAKCSPALAGCFVVESGEGGIRTHGAREDTLVFKTRAINHSTTSPEGVRCPAGHLTTVSGRDEVSALRLGQRKKTFVGITAGRPGFGQFTLVVTLQRFEEIIADATLHYS